MTSTRVADPAIRMSSAVAPAMNTAINTVTQITPVYQVLVLGAAIDPSTTIEEMVGDTRTYTHTLIHSHH